MSQHHQAITHITLTSAGNASTNLMNSIQSSSVIETQPCVPEQPVRNALRDGLRYMDCMCLFRPFNITLVFVLSHHIVCHISRPELLSKCLIMKRSYICCNPGAIQNFPPRSLIPS